MFGGDMFGGEQLNEASLRAMRAKYFGGDSVVTQMVANGEFKAGHAKYDQVYRQMRHEGKGAMQVVSLMTQIGNMITPGVRKDMQKLRENHPQLYAMLGMGAGMGQTTTAKDSADMVAAPPDRSQKMGYEIQIAERKKRAKKGKNTTQRKKNKKSKNKVDKVPDNIWISTSAPRVRENYPFKRGIQQRQTTPEGRSFTVSTTPPASHAVPDDPVFAIAFPGATPLGPPVDFLTYGGYENANILALDIPDTAATAATSKEGLVGRPTQFMGVDAKFLTQSTTHQWIGGSTRYRCEILCDMEGAVKYYTGKHASAVHENNDGCEPQHHHGNKLQAGCIYQQRPTTILVYGDEATPENKDQLSSIAVSISWDVSNKGDYITWKSFRHQPDGRVWEGKTFQKEMNNQNLYFRAFLCAADVQDSVSRAAARVAGT